MTTTPIKPLTLDAFLQQPYIEESPAWEYINGEITQKPMPKLHHSRLQLKLASYIDLIAEQEQIALAFPELRCTFGNRSIVPDIVVLYWHKIPVNETGEPDNTAIFVAPDWTIEILSPNQKPTKVIDNIIHCLEYGSQLGWLIDPDERMILVFQPNQMLKSYKIDSSETLPVLESINLTLTVSQIFSWLKMISQ